MSQLFKTVILFLKDSIFLELLQFKTASLFLGHPVYESQLSQKFGMIQVSDKVCSELSSNLLTLLLHNLSAVYNIVVNVQLLTKSST